jgi:hypothetical protein
MRGLGRVRTVRSMATTQCACDGVVGGLSSWRDGPAKQAIAELVTRVCGGDGREPVPVEERLAVFDNDGTLWCEKPMPIQLDFILHRLVEMAEADAALRGRQPARRAASSARARVSRLRLRADGRVAPARRRMCARLVVAQAAPGLADMASRSVGLRCRAARAVSGARSPARWTTRARPAGWAGASGVLCSSNPSGPSAGSAGSGDEAGAPGLAGDELRGRHGTAP